ncbi:MAG: MFS transporter [Vicinamibacteria bacterium]|jgi:MFS family permease
MTLRGVPRGVVVLGLVSMCMDVSSEMIHALLPLYLATGLGMSMFAIGMLEGAAEALALIVKVFSGAWSDAVRKRKPLVLAGYGLAALTKPIFALAPSFAWVAGARFADRIGKGIRGAPRDALIADITPSEVRGAAFGLRQTLDTVGAVLGPIIAIVALAVFAGNFQHAFWIAVIPAAICVALIVFGVDEPDRIGGGSGERRKLSLADANRLPLAFWLVSGIATLMAIARCSEAFLVLRAADVGFAPVQAPWVMVVMSVVYAASAYPAGRALDDGKGSVMLYAGLATLVAAHASLAFANGGALLFAGAALWGLHMGLTQGVFAALVAQHAPADLRGTAFGVFNFAQGIGILIASAAAGALWDAFGARYAFAFGAAFAVLSAAALVASSRALRHH